VIAYSNYKLTMIAAARCRLRWRNPIHFSPIHDSDNSYKLLKSSADMKPCLNSRQFTCRIGLIFTNSLRL